MKEFCTTKLCIIALYITLLKKLKIFTKSIGLILYPIFIAPCPFLSPNMVNQTTTLVSKPEKKIMYKTYINIPITGQVNTPKGVTSVVDSYNMVHSYTWSLLIIILVGLIVLLRNIVILSLNYPIRPTAIFDKLTLCLVTRLLTLLFIIINRDYLHKRIKSIITFWPIFLGLSLMSCGAGQNFLINFVTFFIVLPLGISVTFRLYYPDLRRYEDLSTNNPKPSTQIAKNKDVYFRYKSTNKLSNPYKTYDNWVIEWSLLCSSYIMVFLLYYPCLIILYVSEQPSLEPDAFLKILGVQWNWLTDINVPVDAKGFYWIGLNNLFKYNIETNKNLSTMINLTLLNYIYEYIYEGVYSTELSQFFYHKFVFTQSPLNLKEYILGKGGFLSSTNLATFLPRTAIIKIVTGSKDVLHSFWVWSMAVKNDCISEKPIEQSVDITHESVSSGSCAEYCGDYHSRMPIMIKAYNPELRKYNN